MGKQRNKKRITSKIDELPEQLRLQVDLMLADTSNTYVEISQFLKTAGMRYQKALSAGMRPGPIQPCSG